jgi:TonB family protein
MRRKKLLQDGVTMATQPTDTAKPRVKTASDELTVIAQRAQAFTNASGTAIALSEGNADEIVCRARSGAAAPEVGAALRVEGSFTGLCIQTGKELRCDDAETDTRVDTAAIRALGIRSMVVTPIKEDNKVIGVLACFAPTAHAFTITHVAVLKTMADQITVLLQKERRAREEGVVQPAVEISVAKPASSPDVVPAPAVIRPVVSPVPAAARSQFPQVAKVEPVAAPVPFPKKEEKRTEVRASFGTLDAVSGQEAKSDPKIKILAAAAVLVVAGLATFGVLKMRKPQAPAQPAQEIANTATNTPSAVPQPQTSQPAGTANASAAPAAPSVVANPVPVTANSRNSAASSLDTTRRPDRPAAKVSEEAPRPAPAPAATVALANGPSHIKMNSNNAAPSAELAPSLNVGSNGAGSLSALAKPVSTAPSAALAQSDLEPMKVLKQVPATYPAIAKVRRMSGSVTIEVTVGKDGKAHNPRFVSGQPIFRDAAFDAVKEWVFKPAKLNGEAIEQATQIKMDFHP